MKRTFSPDFYLLLLIIIIGAIFRLFRPFEIPFTFDELSALNRVKVSSFAELIEKGVRNDGHPAGIQIFLYCWSRLFGISELVIKLPFIFFGIASIALVYCISKKWFSSTTGLLAAACLATLQFPITYSDIARPYISGLFFSLLMVMCWSNYFFDEKRKFLNLAGFGISAALCAYNHYFSLLLAVIVGVTGLFFLTREKLIPYLLACFFAVLLFAPHLELFLFQYGTGGLDWLGKPRDDFFIQFVEYIFHYSTLVICIVLLISVFGIINGRKELRLNNKFRVICIVWFILPYVIGFHYSLNVKPVLQFSVLIFSFPYLLIFLFSFFNQATTALKVALIALLILVNTYTLVFHRQHFQIFYKQPVEELALNAVAFGQNINNSAPDIIYNVDTNYINYYFKKPGFKPRYYSIYHNMPGPVDFRKMIASNKSNLLVTGRLPLEYLKIATEYYPYENFKDFGYTYEIYCFSKNGSEKAFANETLFESTFGMSNDKYWSLNRTDDSGNDYVALDSSKEWGPTFRTSLHNLIPTNNRHHIVDIFLSARDTAEIVNGIIVFELTQQGRSLEWRPQRVSDFMDKDKLDEWQNVYFSVRFSDIFKSHAEMEDVQMKIFYWNKEKQKVNLKNFTISIRKGNDWVYGMLERLD